MAPASPKRKKAIAGLAVVITLALAAFVCWASFQPLALEDVKKLTITVSHTDGEFLIYEKETTARYLLEALESCDYLVIEEGAEGHYVLAADNEYATDYSGVYWTYNVNGEPAENYIDTQRIADGDVYSFYLTTF